MKLHRGWTSTGITKPSPVLKNGKSYKRPWPHQKKALKVTQGHRYVFFNQPTGSGKSQQMMRWVLDVMFRDPKVKIIVTVPQKVIGHGFLLDGLHLTGKLAQWTGTQFFDWFVLSEHNLLSTNVTRKAHKLKAFLESPVISDFPQSRVLVCTHNVIRDFAAQYPDFKWNNTALCIDEAHHLMAQDDEGSFLTNGCGDVAVKFLSCMDNLYLCIATATYGRHDKFTCVPPSLDRKIVRFELPFDEYLLMMDHLRSFSYEVCFYKDSPFASIANLLDPKGENAICYLAKRNTSHATSYKDREVKSLVTALAKRLNAKVSRKGPLYTLTHSDGVFRVLDIVTQDTQSEAESFLETVKNPDDLQLIIALEKCTEGFDWKYARKSFIIGERHSIPQMIQIFGRLFRDVKGKRSVRIYQLLCSPTALVESEKYRKYRSQYLNTIMAAMLLVDVYLPSPVNQKKGKKSSDFLRKQVATINDRMALEHAALRKLAEIEASHETVEDESTIIYDEWRKSAPSLLKRFGVTENTGKVALQFWAKYKRMGMNGKDIPLDKLKRGRALSGLLSYVAEELGIADFKELRKVIAPKMTEDECRKEIKRLALEHGGTLPHDYWLQANGYGALAKRVRNDRTLLGDITQDVIYRSKEMVTSEVRRLAAENGGRLQKSYQLLEMGYGWLSQRIDREPELLGDIVQEQGVGHSDDECRMVVKQLAMENGGMLPHPRALRRLGYQWVHRRVRENPSLLGKIKQERKRAA